MKELTLRIKSTFSNFLSSLELFKTNFFIYKSINIVIYSK